MDADGQHRQLAIDDVHAIKADIALHRFAATPFDIVVEGRTPGNDPDRAAEVTRRWADAGATWWIEAMWGDPDQPVDYDAIRRRIQPGPPRFEQ